MANKRKGQLTTTGEWARHLRPVLRRAFWKGERQAGKVVARSESDATSPPAATGADVISRRGTTLVRRLVLEPGSATPWHVDPHHRVTVVVRGEALAIEYRDGGKPDRFEVFAGLADWDEPTGRVHRAVNVGRSTYEEVAIFFLDRPDAPPQPIVE